MWAGVGWGVGVGVGWGMGGWGGCSLRHARLAGVTAATELLSVLDVGCI